jgi:hypothetical protein
LDRFESVSAFMTLPFRGRVTAGLLLFLATGCSTVEHAQQCRDAAQEPPKPYVRIFRETTNRTELQVALRRFMPPRGIGPSIWLVGVSHLGAPDYFVKLQSKLDEKTLVLYEGISSSGRKASGPSLASGLGSERDEVQHEMNSAEGLQPALARALGLRFQLEAIDYSRPSFQNSDLSIPELRQLLMEQSAGSKDQGAAREFEGLLQAMQGQSLLNALIRVAIPFLATSPGLQGVTKLALIEVLGQIDGNPANISGLPESAKQLLVVLLDHRNQRVMDDLQRELLHMRKHDSAAILYGVAHMPDLEQRLRTRLHYRPAETHWLTAFEVDSEKAGISAAQIRFLRELLRGELHEISN